MLDTDVGPQPLHARQQLLRERLRVLHSRYDVHHHLGITLFNGKIKIMQSVLGHLAERAFYKFG